MTDEQIEEQDGFVEVPVTPLPMRVFVVHFSPDTSMPLSGRSVLVEAHSVREQGGVLSFWQYVRNADKRGYTEYVRNGFRVWEWFEEMIGCAPSSQVKN